MINISRDCSYFLIILYMRYSMIKIDIHNSSLVYRNNCAVVNDYYQYIVRIIKEVLENTKDLHINIILGNEHYVFDNTINKTLRITINFEHTLITPSVEPGVIAPIGNIKDISGNNYLVRIDNYKELQLGDIIIDYSIPNIYNIKESKVFSKVANKIIYIYPSIYDTYYIKNNRSIVSLTTFIDIKRPRRKLLLDTLEKCHTKHININNCFDIETLKLLYTNTKVMINIHQTPYHHTFEELRVLPALQCGVLVICENSPLREMIPYNDYIIWSDYDSIIAKRNHVLENYDEYYENIFGNTQNKKVGLNDLKYINYYTLHDTIIKTSYSL